MHPRTVSTLALALCLALPSLAAAQEPEPTDALEAPLRGFSRADVQRFDNLLEGGTVGLVELAHGALLPAVHLAAVVDAPPDAVASIIASPEGYPTYMPAVSQVSVSEREGAMTAYSWRWQTAVFSLHGQSMLTHFAAPPGHPERGHRIAVRRTEGDLGHGREVWRVLPRGTGSLVLLSTRMDLRDANYLTRAASAGSRSLSRSINLAMATAMLLRTREEAERRAGRQAERATEEHSLARPDVDLERLAPLLRRGDMLVLEGNAAGLDQVAVISRYDQDEPRVRAIMLDPVAFTEALIPGSTATIRERTDEGLDFDWAVNRPIIGTSGRMILDEDEDGVVHLDATAGALDGGAWRFTAQRLRGGGTGILGWASFDVGSANFLIRAIIDADAALGPGLNAATVVMMSRALRIRVAR